MKDKTLNEKGLKERDQVVNLKIVNNIYRNTCTFKFLLNIQK